MVKLTPGRILLADNRPVTSTDSFQYFEYQMVDAEVQKLAVCRDEFLAARQEIWAEAPTDGYRVIIPVTGALDIICGGQLPLRLDVGEVLIRYQKEGDHCTLVNQYEGDWINFIHLHIKTDLVSEFDEVTTFDLEQNPDQLINIAAADLPFKLNIGMFGGRAEALYQPQPGRNIFALVIAGVFEMQGRLIHERDGLALWDIPEANLEALSNNAVILVVEF